MSTVSDSRSPAEVRSSVHEIMSGGIESFESFYYGIVWLTPTRYCNLEESAQLRYGNGLRNIRQTARDRWPLEITLF